MSITTEGSKDQSIDFTSVFPWRQQWCFSRRVLVETNFEASKRLFSKAFRSLKDCLDWSTITKARCPFPGFPRDSHGFSRFPFRAIQGTKGSGLAGPFGPFGSKIPKKKSEKRLRGLPTLGVEKVWKESKQSQSGVILTRFWVSAPRAHPEVPVRPVMHNYFPDPFFHVGLSSWEINDLQSFWVQWYSSG